MVALEEELMSEAQELATPMMIMMENMITETRPHNYNLRNPDITTTPEAWLGLELRD